MPFAKRCLTRLLPALLAAGALSLARGASAADLLGVDDPLHGYFSQAPTDRFSRLRAEWEDGRRALDPSGELPFLRSLLRELEVPVSSQMLVYSVTSLQKRLISPRRPRALFFNDDTYVGYVPGGQIEVVSLDPALGGIFYIFDRLQPGQPPRVGRSDECMTCHATRHMEEIPGLVIESVVPGITGGGEKAFRREQSGHGIPLALRFGGWHVTGTAADFPRHWGNLLIERAAGEVHERPIQPGELFDWARYPAATSDILPQLLHEHQVGFVNRAIHATYRTRTLLAAHGGRAQECGPELDAMARALVRYLLFADEVPLPPCGVEGDRDFKSAFATAARKTSGGASLRDLDLRTRLLRHRCSYMIYSPTFAGLPPPVKERVCAVLEQALSDAPDAEEGAHLPPEERQAIRTILKETLPELPGGWGES